MEHWLQCSKWYYPHHKHRPDGAVLHADGYGVIFKGEDVIFDQESAAAETISEFNYHQIKDYDSLEQLWISIEDLESGNLSPRFEWSKSRPDRLQPLRPPKVIVPLETYLEIAGYGEF